MSCGVMVSMVLWWVYMAKYDISRDFKMTQDLETSLQHLKSTYDSCFLLIIFVLGQLQ